MTSTFLNKLPLSQLSKDMDQLFTDFEYLGLFDEYGSCCLFINQLLLQSLRQKNYQVQLISCYALMEEQNQRFFLGHKDYIKPGQLAGHVTCLVNQAFLVDFGLGNLHKCLATAPQAIAFQAQASDHLFGELYLSNLAKIAWHPIDDIPNLAFETARQQPKLDEVFQQLHAFQKNRLKYAIHRALFKKRKKSTTPKLVPRTNFDETYF